MSRRYSNNPQINADLLQQEEARRKEVAARQEFLQRAQADPTARRFLPDPQAVNSMSDAQWNDTQSSILRFAPHLANTKVAGPKIDPAGPAEDHAWPTNTRNPALDSLRKIPGMEQANISGAGITVPVEAESGTHQVQVTPNARTAATLLTGVDPASVSPAQRTANLRAAVGQDPGGGHAMPVPDISRYLEPGTTPSVRTAAAAATDAAATSAKVNDVAYAPENADPYLTNPRGAATDFDASTGPVNPISAVSLGAALPPSPAYPLSASERAGASVRNAGGEVAGFAANALISPVNIAKSAYNAVTQPVSDFVHGLTGSNASVSRGTAADFTTPTQANPLPGTPTSPSLNVDQGPSSLAKFGLSDDELKNRSQFAGF